MTALASYKLLPGYAETSTRRHPLEPTTVIVGRDECERARCVGTAFIDGRADWLAFKIPGERRYYFQCCPR